MFSNNQVPVSDRFRRKLQEFEKDEYMKYARMPKGMVIKKPKSI